MYVLAGKYARAQPADLFGYRACGGDILIGANQSAGMYKACENSLGYYTAAMLEVQWV